MIALSSVHKNLPFSKSKALQQGIVGPVDRARVVDLWSFDDDKPASPSQRVPVLHSFFLQTRQSRGSLHKFDQV